MPCIEEIFLASDTHEKLNFFQMCIKVSSIGKGLTDQIKIRLLICIDGQSCDKNVDVLFFVEHKGGKWHFHCCMHMHISKFYRTQQNFKDENILQCVHYLLIIVFIR